MRQYKIILHEGRKGWTAEVPDLPGVYATGKTEEEIKQRILSAIDFHIASLEEDGEPVPEPAGKGGFTLRKAEEIFTTAEAAEQLGVSPGRVRQLILQGRLKATRFGRDLAILEKDLDAVRDRAVGRPAAKKEKVASASARVLSARAATQPPISTKKASNTQLDP